MIRIFFFLIINSLMIGDCLFFYWTCFCMLFCFSGNWYYIEIEAWSDREAKVWFYTRRFYRRTLRSSKLSSTNSHSSLKVPLLSHRARSLWVIHQEDGWTYLFLYQGVFKQEQEQEKLREELELTTNLLEKKITNYRESNAKHSRGSVRMSQEFIPLEERKNSIFRVSSAFK